MKVSTKEINRHKRFGFSTVLDTLSVAPTRHFVGARPLFRIPDGGKTSTSSGYETPINSAIVSFFSAKLETMGFFIAAASAQSSSYSINISNKSSSLCTVTIIWSKSETYLFIFPCFITSISPYLAHALSRSALSHVSNVVIYTSRVRLACHCST